MLNFLAKSEPHMLIRVMLIKKKHVITLNSNLTPQVIFSHIFTYFHIQKAKESGISRYHVIKTVDFKSFHSKI